MVDFTVGQRLCHPVLTHIDQVPLVIPSGPIQHTFKGSGPYLLSHPHPSGGRGASSITALDECTSTSYLCDHQPWLGVCLMNPMICCHLSASVWHHWSRSKHTHRRFCPHPICLDFVHFSFSLFILFLPVAIVLFFQVKLSSLSETSVYL